MAAEPLPASFYARDVVDVARDLLGCVLESRHGCAGVIIETEAYHQSEPSCHAYRGITERTRPLFGPPGLAYVYFTYGMHWCFNAVCEPEGVGAAVLIRAVVPVAGLEQMHARRERTRPLKVTELCSGPAKLVQAMDIRSTDNDHPLDAAPLRIVRDDAVRDEAGVAVTGRRAVAVGPRIGISTAQELPWRFGVAGSAFLSKPF